jgi:hypothetical protein
MIDFSILQLSMTDGLVDGLVRVLGTLPMTLVCMLIMFTEGLRPGIRSFIAFAAGQGAFLLFLLLAPFWCINLWYTIEPGLAIFSLYCIGRVIHIYFNLSVFSLGFKFLQPTYEGKDFPFVRYIFLANFLGSTEVGTNFMDVTSLVPAHLYPLAYTLTYMVWMFVLPPLFSFGLLTLYRNRPIPGDRQRALLSGWVIGLIAIFFQTFCTYSSGLFFHYPLQLVGVPDEYVGFHEEEGADIRTTQGDLETNLWYGPSVLPGDKEAEVNKHREAGLFSGEGENYVYDPEHVKTLVDFWELSPFLWFERMINVKRMELNTPSDLKETLLRSPEFITSLGREKNDEPLKGILWHNWYYTYLRPSASPFYYRTLQMPKGGFPTNTAYEYRLSQTVPPSIIQEMQMVVAHNIKPALITKGCNMLLGLREDFIQDAENKLIERYSLNLVAKYEQKQAAPKKAAPKKEKKLSKPNKTDALLAEKLTQKKVQSASDVLLNIPNARQYSLKLQEGRYFELMSLSLSEDDRVRLDEEAQRLGIMAWENFLRTLYYLPEDTLTDIYTKTAGDQTTAVQLLIDGMLHVRTSLPDTSDMTFMESLVADKFRNLTTWTQADLQLLASIASGHSSDNKSQDIPFVSSITPSQDQTIHNQNIVSNNEEDSLMEMTGYSRLAPSQGQPLAKPFEPLGTFLTRKTRDQATTDLTDFKYVLTQPQTDEEVYEDEVRAGVRLKRKTFAEMTVDEQQRILTARKNQKLKTDSISDFEGFDEDHMDFQFPYQWADLDPRANNPFPVTASKNLVRSSIFSPVVGKRKDPVVLSKEQEAQALLEKTQEWQKLDAKQRRMMIALYTQELVKQNTGRIDRRETEANIRELKKDLDGARKSLQDEQRSPGGVHVFDTDIK